MESEGSIGTVDWNDRKSFITRRGGGGIFWDKTKTVRSHFFRIDSEVAEKDVRTEGGRKDGRMDERN